MINSIFNTEIFKILTLFSISKGSRLQRKELKDKTKMNNVVLDNALSSLLNAGIIKKDKRLFCLNLENDNAKIIAEIAVKQYQDFREIPFKVYFAIVEIADFLSKLKFLSAYLFGSYAKLVFNDNSDIDVAIISNIKDIIKRDFAKLMQKLESRYSVKIEVHYFSNNFYKNKKDPLVNEILKNGIKII